VGITTCGISIIFYKIQTLSLIEVLRHEKTLTLNNYQAMINIGPLGGKAVPLFRILLVP
jgi:hypothetical protein